MSNQNLTAEEQAVMNRSANDKGFTPNTKNKNRRALQNLPHQPPEAPPIAPLESTTDTLRDAIGSMAEYSTQSTDAIATQREVVADRVADQMAALLGPDLFVQDVMARTVAKLNQRTVEIPNFFDITLNLPPAPKLRQLPAAPESAP
jgi:hypothetical protein